MLLVDDRIFHLDLKSPSHQDLSREFELICKDDALFLDRLLTMVPQFYWKKPAFVGTPFEHNEFELLPTEKISDFSTIRVKWVKKQQVCLSVQPKSVHS